MLMEHGATTSLEERRWFAKEAFSFLPITIQPSSTTSMAKKVLHSVALPIIRRLCATARTRIRRVTSTEIWKLCSTRFTEREISYNNLLDINAAVDLIDEFEETTFAVLKHNNACGLASRPTVLEAWNDALAGDPVSAFGGVLITNGVIDKDAAEEINKNLL